MEIFVVAFIGLAALSLVVNFISWLFDLGKLKNCAACDARISKEAAACPKCGHPN